MKDPIRLDDKTQFTLANKIGRKTNKYLKNAIQKEFSKITDSSEIDISDFVNALLLTLANIDLNFLFWLEEIHKAVTKREMNNELLINSFAENLKNMYMTNIKNKVH